MEHISQCPKCGSDIKRVPAGVSKRTGKPYNAFLSCTNRECDYTARSNQPTTKSSSGQIIMEELAGINARLDKLIAYVVEKLK